MSAIAGVWNVSGEPLDPTVLSRMSAALGHRGPDGEGRHVAGAIGFAHQRLWVTPEDAGEIQPLAGRGGAMLVMDGRLDNRDELLPALGLARTASDAACALGAYEAWGDGFAAHLNGDFAVAIFDELKQRLLLARDAIGIRPLYYHRTARLCAFATEIKALLAHPDVPVRPDDEGLADYMLLDARPLDRQDATCFADIAAVVPSHLVVITPDRVLTRQYWDFDPGRTIRLRSFGEYAEAFRERFAEAVRRRVRSVRPVAVSVSGGLDSSSVFCQAEALRRAGAAPCPSVAGISYIGTEGTDADERQYLLDIEREYGVTIERYPIEPLVGLIEGVDDQIRTIEAPFLDYMWGVTRELHRRAAAAGARVLLSGHWGDQVFFSPAYLVDLFGRFAWGEIRRHTREYERWFSAGEAQVLVRRFPLDVARHHVPVSLVPPLKWIRRRLPGGARQKRWFSDPFLRRALRFADRPATIGRAFHSAHARSIYIEARSKYHVHCMEWHNKIDALGGLEAAFPCLDRDLLAFLMAVPGDIQNRNGVPRALLREAMKGVLPEPVRARRWKADFTSVVNRGVALDASPLARALSPESRGVRLGYLDPGRLASEVARLSDNLSTDNCLDSWELADLYGFEMWLQVFLNADDRTAST
jgi:asparagine synthase (glutamine-hydrolysing)